MKIVISGASGFLGSALVPALRAAGHDVRRLVRRVPSSSDEIPWNPARSDLAPAALAGTEAIINLAGENVGARWTAARRERILRSRVDATRTLVAAAKQLSPAPLVFLSASAVGFYGDRGDELLDESSAMGHGFLPEVCLAWETHAEAAARAGIRTVFLRFSTILDAKGGALARMLPLFRLGLGGRLGSGTQWMSWVSLPDTLGAIQHALVTPACGGPVNIVAPDPVPNATFTATLAHVLRRPAFLPAPAWALRLAFGRMADEALLSSLRAQPAALRRTGYAFQHPTLEAALQALV
jgi:uncharacterized protein (TIGR01777 family)